MTVPVPPNVAMPTLWNIAAICISAIALFIAFLNFRRKSALNLRGVYSWTPSNVDTEDQHTSSIVIENLKDRAVTIFKIYLRVGHNYYIQIDDFENNPLILRAFETWHKEYGCLERYNVNFFKISMNELFYDKRAKKRLVLSTSNGKYTIKKGPHHWKPVEDFFKNHSTAIIHPIRAFYKETAIGGRVPYVVDIAFDGSPNEVITVHRRDYQSKIFYNFQLTQESLETAESLKIFLQKQIELGTLICKSYDVFDAEAWRAAKYSDEISRQPITAKYMNLFQYHVMGRINTLKSKRRLRKQNR
jgi:hypothetical protein